jgi:DNA polymerase elongation subunit (family B)
MLQRVYYDIGHCSKIKSTIGSQALEIYAKRFKCCNLKLLRREVIDVWRKGYGGGWCECFKKGKFDSDVYYKIDVNSLYPFIMSTSYPFPYKYSVVNTLSKKQRQYSYWLGVKNGEVFNSIEHKKKVCEYYYLFPQKIYPFKAYVLHFYNKKKYARGLRRIIYKLLLNSLYGKFAQRNEVDVVSNYRYKSMKNIFYQEQIVNDLYRIKFTNQSKIWVNVIWSLFTTAKARQYMRNIKRYIEKQGLTVYYTDTDSFILSGDMQKIKTIIDDNKLGQFKIEDMTTSMDIRGKKFYQFGSIYKCKGVPLPYRQEFFEKGKVEFTKMVKYKEALRRNLKVGMFIKTKKEDIKNRETKKCVKK